MVSLVASPQQASSPQQNNRGLRAERMRDRQRTRAELAVAKTQSCARGVGASSIVLGSPGLSLSAGGAPNKQTRTFGFSAAAACNDGCLTQSQSAHRTGRPCSCSSWCLWPWVRPVHVTPSHPLASCSVCFCPRRVPGMAHANAPGPGLTACCCPYRSSYSIRRLVPFPPCAPPPCPIIS